MELIQPEGFVLKGEQCLSITNKSLNSDTYERLKREIMMFSLKPGEAISAAKIAAKYEVSRTPAREAIVKLETEGLVQIYPHSRTLVSRIDRKRANQEWFVRKTLELGMADAFIERLTDADLALMRSYNEKLVKCRQEPMDHERAYNYIRYDDAMHAVSHHVAGEELAAAVIATSMSHYNRIRLLVDLDAGQRDKTIAEHEQLLGYAQKRERDHYRQALQAHLSRIETDIETMFEQYPDYFEAADPEDGWGRNIKNPHQQKEARQGTI